MRRSPPLSLPFIGDPRAGTGALPVNDELYHGIPADCLGFGIPATVLKRAQSVLYLMRRGPGAGSRRVTVHGPLNSTKKSGRAPAKAELSVARHSARPGTNSCAGSAILGISLGHGYACTGGGTSILASVFGEEPQMP
eukprot:90358-Hanusia_phi.AAC.1